MTTKRISELHYDHLQFYVDKLKPLAHYKAIEERLNAFAQLGAAQGVDLAMKDTATGGRPVAAARDLWVAMTKPGDGANTPYASADPADFKPHGQDLVEQLLYGLAWRVTGEHAGSGTRSVLLTTNDPTGVKLVLTAKTAGKEQERSGEKSSGSMDVDGSSSSSSSSSSSNSSSSSAEPHSTVDHFASRHVDRYTDYHAGEQGIAVLGFNLQQEGEFARVVANYQTKHPALVLPGSPRSYKQSLPTTTSTSGDAAEVMLVNVFEVFAYYRKKAGSANEEGEGAYEGDPGTVIRFVERVAEADGSALLSAAGSANMPLPGLLPVAHAFDGTGSSAYCDHWVSNVIDRERFLQTLEDTLGFTPKVDFNAGVVAAGEAQIESTVTGNTSPLLTADPAAALRDTGQVFLPTNNALSPVGHVHWYLEQLGQGIQHVASRVE